MPISPLSDSSQIAPIEAVLSSDQRFILAVITGIEGPSYRPLGAMMAIQENGTRYGTLSSGCVESDIALQALETLETGIVKSIRYGRGSNYVDIQLPCGGGLDVTLFPMPDRAVLQALVDNVRARVSCGLMLDLTTGSFAVEATLETQNTGHHMQIAFEPETFFYVFGKGPEAVTFASLVEAAGFPNVLCSPDEETIEAALAGGNEVIHLTKPMVPETLGIDAHSAVVLFFHDHDWEPPILASVLTSEAFYVGAQGSQRSASLRHAGLLADGVSASDLDRLRGPIGLIPSARDARKLAVSVLAEVMQQRDNK